MFRNTFRWKLGEKSRTINYLKMSLNERCERNFDDDITIWNFSEFRTKRSQSRLSQTFCLLSAHTHTKQLNSKNSLFFFNFFLLRSTAPAEKIHRQKYLWEILRTMMYFNQTSTYHLIDSEVIADYEPKLSKLIIISFLRSVCVWACLLESLY